MKIETNGSDAGNQFASLYLSIVEKEKQANREWITKLMDDGIKAAHPDDGWVDRKKNTVRFAYPQFRLKIEVGDRIALGWPKKWRIVKVIEITNGLFGETDYHFEPL